MYIARMKIATLAAVTLISGCAQTPPPIAKQAEEKGAGPYYARFANYVPTAYPVGSEAQRLEYALRSQGFRIQSPAPGKFLADDMVWYCDGGYLVRWHVDDDGKLAAISAEEHNCPGP